MKKFFIIITPCLLLFVILIFAGKVSAQDDHLKYFTLLRLLAGDPQSTSYNYILPSRIEDIHEKRPITSVPVSFNTVPLQVEQNLRLGLPIAIPGAPPPEIRGERVGISLQPLPETTQEMFSQMTDPASEIRRINVSLGQIDLFKEGPNLKKFYDHAQSIGNENISEIDKIGEIYAKVMESLSSHGFPSGGAELENALAEGTGLCREKALLLRQGLMKAGIESELVFSENHAWVRVTLSESGELTGFQFDLDPRLYMDPIPLCLAVKLLFRKKKSIICKIYGKNLKAEPS